MEKDIIVSRSLGLVKNVKIIKEESNLANMTIYYKIQGEVNEKGVLKALRKKTVEGSIDDIKSSGECYFGEAEHANFRKADKKAIENLIVNIADNMQSAYADILPKDEDIYEFTESILKTYRSAFTGCKKKIEGKKILRYINKADVSKLFTQRLKKLNDYIEFGMKAEKEIRIGDALKYYYWAFALSDIAVKDILSKPELFGSIQNKLQIMQFMENDKTAYCLENLDYIREVFAENALIIVGKVLKRSNKQVGEMYNKLGNDKVKYVKMSKKAYMESLELVFRSNEFINIQFEDNIISKMGRNDKVYGIQIKQNYFSSNYANEGYLFLMMDLSDPKKPTIYVRSWQPEKNPDGSIIGLEDFE